MHTDIEKKNTKKNSKELRRKEQAETSQGVINVQSDLDWKRDETSRILEGLGLPEQAPQGKSNYSGYHIRLRFNPSYNV